jgi:AcrR family transcriptional regulator
MATTNPRETKAARTRRRILRSAAHELVEHGYGGASLRRIADGAELQLGSLYFHFATKDDLMREVLRDAVDFALAQLQQAIDQLGPAAAPGERISAAIGAHIHTLHAAGDRGAAVANGPRTFPSEMRRRYGTQVRRYTRVWDELITTAQRDGAIDPDLDYHALRELLMSAMNGTLSAGTRDPTTLELAAQTLAALILRP